MRVSSLLVTLAGASYASAAMMKLAANSVSWNWTVTGWSAGCARECSYDFNVTGVGNTTSKPAKPSFKAHCSGEGVGAGYTQCTALEDAGTDYAVVAQLLPQGNATNGTAPHPQIQVSLKFTDLNSSSTWWNYTGKADTSYNQAVAPPLNFTIVPDTIFGVA
ncbi:hypothetical protein F4804DRAFT_240179 [Jackrogersella minutella]|nr:hypothetical protein F4804DRAFT_240179 [Jackrogersella minutella]